MAHLTTLSLLIIVLVQQTLATRQVINAGQEYSKDCAIRISHDPDRYILQFFMDKTEVKMFNSRYTNDQFRLVSNGTTIVPTITDHTDRYSVQEVNGQYKLVIKNVTESDSAWYGCRSFDLERNASSTSEVSTELLIPGPFDGVFWTSNFTGLSLDVARQHEIPDRGVVLTDNAWFGPNVACAILVSNLEPLVNITIGYFWDENKIDITDQFETRISSNITIDNVGTVYRETVFFVKKSKFTQTSLRDVYCRASLLRTRHEKSVNIQVTSKPKNKACNPMNVFAMVGSKNVNLTCLIEAHPEPYVEWTLPGGRKINALSNNHTYTVTNEARFEGLFTTLTISEVTKEDNNFGRIEINATNTEGSGLHYLNFKEGSGSGGVMRSSAALITMTTCLLSWMLK